MEQENITSTILVVQKGLTNIARDVNSIFKCLMYKNTSILGHSTSIRTAKNSI